MKYFFTGKINHIINNWVILNKAYELKESLTKRTVDFYRTLSADGTLTIQLWPLESVVTQSNNPYLLRRG